jgi:glycosyltransferase involved in cell wall biosynthesis
MDTPIVNVFMPTYEPNPQHLAEALDSLLAQTETNWSLFIHDDASKSDVQSMIKSYLEDPRITFERSEKNLGIGGNWNACIQRTTAQYAQFLFQDDLWGETHLKKAISALEENPTVGFVSIDHKYQFEGGMENSPLYEKVREYKKENVKAGLHKGEEFLLWWIQQELHPNVIGEPPFVMFRKKLLDTVGPFNEEMPQFLDLEYWIRCLQKTDWYYLKEDIGAFRVHPAAASARNTESGAGIYDRLRCFQQLIASLPSGKMKKEAMAARNRALTVMAGKFLDRVQKKQAVSVSGKGGSAFKKFCLQHPLLTARAMVNALWNKPKQKQD